MSATPKVAVSAVKAALTAAVGADAVTTAPEELSAYTADTYWPALAASAAGTPLARPEIVVRPRTEDDVAAVLAAADAQRTPVVPWGGGSGTQGGALAIHGGIVLDLRSLDRILEVDDTAMTVTVQAGVNGRRLERELNARGLMFPHYPASVEWATVGGYIAARGSGVLSTRYGKIEDLLLTLRVATPATGLIDTVSVPRHAVGPELTQLLVGSEGTLGVITRATLQLVPMPAERRFGPERLRVAGRRGIPQVVVPGCVDFFNQGARDELPERYRARKTYFHNPVATLVRLSADEGAELGRMVAERLNEARGPVRVVVPMRGFSLADAEGGDLWDPEADRAFADSLRDALAPGIPCERVDAHVDAPAFAELVADRYLTLLEEPVHAG